MNSFLLALRTFLLRSRRITTSGEWIPEVDGVRFVAIGLVLMQHIYERVIRRTESVYPQIKASPLGQFLTNGETGVLIFFTLSGYILARILTRSYLSGNTPDLRKFYLRRVTRLEPPYLLVMTGIFALLAVTGYRSSYAHSFNQGAQTLTGAWLASAFYVYCPIFGTLPKLNPPAWSLEIEIQFYILAPLFTWLLTRLPGRIRLGSALLIALLWGLSISAWSSGNPHLHYTLLRFFPFFFGGFAVLEAQRAFDNVLSLRPGFRRAADVAAVGALLWLVGANLWFPSAKEITGQMFAAFLFVAGCLMGSGIRRFLALPGVAVIGGMCYSIYLIHLTVIEAAVGLTSHIGRGLPFGAFLAIQFLLLVPTVLVPAWLFFRMVEQPCMERDWPKRLWQAIRNRRPRVVALENQDG